MEDKEIFEGPIGAVGKYDVEFKDGALVAGIEAGKFGVSSELKVKIDAAAVLDALSKAIPGQIDDSIFELLKKLLVK